MDEIVKKSLIKATKYAGMFTIVFALYLIFVWSKVVLCKPCAEICDSIWPRLLQTCDCCVTFSDFFGDVVRVIIAPFAISFAFFTSIFYAKYKKKSN